MAPSANEYHMVGTRKKWKENENENKNENENENFLRGGRRANASLRFIGWIKREYIHIE